VLDDEELLDSVYEAQGDDGRRAVAGRSKRPPRLRSDWRC